MTEPENSEENEENGVMQNPPDLTVTKMDAGPDAEHPEKFKKKDEEDGE